MFHVSPFECCLPPFKFSLRVERLTPLLPRVPCHVPAAWVVTAGGTVSEAGTRVTCHVADVMVAAGRALPLPQDRVKYKLDLFLMFGLFLLSLPGRGNISVLIDGR